MRSLLFLLSFGFCLTSFPIFAETAEQDAIGHMIKFVEPSSCTLYAMAPSMIPGSSGAYQKKYNYFKRAIHSAEDFIALTATKSELSGKPYLVRCGKGEKMSSANWLRAELQNFRSGDIKN